MPRRPLRQIPPFLIVLLALTLLCAASVIAAVPDPAIYLTANLTAVATTAAVTTMEQALLDLIAGATTSIDAAVDGVGEGEDGYGDGVVFGAGVGGLE